MNWANRTGPGPSLPQLGPVGAEYLEIKGGPDFDAQMSFGALDTPQFNHLLTQRTDVRMPRRGSERGIYFLLCAYLAVLGLWGCATQPMLIPIEEAGRQDPTQLARLEEDSRWPVLLRAVDGTMLESYRVPTPFFPYQYLVPPGRRVLWVMSPAEVLGATPIPAGRIHCYTIDVELQANVVYRLREDRSAEQALLVRVDSGDVVARGPLVDQFLSGTRHCRWR